ncbi:hypothetical protein [Niveispirillum sp. KHB5.9]|uniref:hypothetical protein n=1 Tax=Niveispirillum sp. KHB5.9 TaxID=3400269 RepID=UPI003A8627CD
MRKTLLLIALILGLLGLGYFLHAYLTVDRCLDSGGQWDRTNGLCVGAEASLKH